MCEEKRGNAHAADTEWYPEKCPLSGWITEDDPRTTQVGLSLTELTEMPGNESSPFAIQLSRPSFSAPLPSKLGPLDNPECTSIFPSLPC